MDSKNFRTPQKFLSNHSPGLNLAANSRVLSTPQSKFMRCGTPNSITRKTTATFSLFPVMHTPPSTFPKVINPFEAALTERLHLPLICSPSLFQRPNTPQHSSTQFEWTIEEVSSLGPANVEPHETQFEDTIDPDTEAKAQAAISSYFKEQIYVPSPVDCQLRKQKIILPERRSSSPIVRPGRRIRDGIAQTVMTIPPIVPLEVENILRTFLTFNADQQQSPTVDCDTTLDYEARDASLRRKLFHVSPCNDTHEYINDIDDKGFSPPPTTPELDTEHIEDFGSPFGKNSFGSLSPISKPNSPLSTSRINSMRRAQDLGHDDTDLNNSFNINVASNHSNSTNVITENHKQTVPSPDNESFFRSTPDHSMISSPDDMSVDTSLNRNTGNLVINSSKKLFTTGYLTRQKPLGEIDIFEHSLNNSIEDEDMQVSQLSGNSNNSSNSSQHHNTPKLKRYASRKNLSQSFSAPVTTDDEDEYVTEPLMRFKKVTTAKRSISDMNEEATTASVDAEKTNFYRVDSGFNEMTTQDESKLKFDEDDTKRKDLVLVNVTIEGDVSMTC